MKLVQFSTPRFGAIVLEEISKKIKPSLLVCNPDKLSGRKKILKICEAKKVALKLQIEIFQPESLKEKEVIEFLKKKNPDLFLVTSFGKIIPKEVLEIPKFKTLGLHPSLLPELRGPSPIQSAILEGKKITGTTLFLLDEKMDHGPILSQKTLQLKGNETYLELEEKLAKLSAKLFLENFKDWIEGKITPLPQNETLATYCKKFKFEDGEIFPKKETASEIERKIRALNPEPGTYIKISNSTPNHTRYGVAQNSRWFWAKSQIPKIIKILEVEIIKEKEIKDFSKKQTFFEFKKELAIKCKKDAILVKILQKEGKKPMKSSEFLCGNKWILEFQ